MNLVALADGGSRGNPGPAACGFIMLKFSETEYQEILKISQNRDDLTELFQHFQYQNEDLISGGQFLNSNTNNYAEWFGVKIILQEIAKISPLPETNLTILLDSELVVKQISGVYKIKNPELKILSQQILPELKKLRSFNIKHIFRAANFQADAIVNQILDQNS